MFDKTLHWTLSKNSAQNLRSIENIFACQGWQLVDVIAIHFQIFHCCWINISNILPYHTRYNFPLHTVFVKVHDWSVTLLLSDTKSPVTDSQLTVPTNKEWKAVCDSVINDMLLPSEIASLLIYIFTTLFTRRVQWDKSLPCQTFHQNESTNNKNTSRVLYQTTAIQNDTHHIQFQF